MKAFTAILMLCLPMAAMGETFVCKAEKFSRLSEQQERARANSSRELIVDTEKGMRLFAEGTAYYGSCQRSSGNRGTNEVFVDLLVCADENYNDVTYIKLILDFKDRTFTETYQTTQAVGIGHMVQSYWGRCVEI